MARKRPHARRFLFALLMLVLIALLLEINRWLPGGLPGGGGDGGFREREAHAAGTEDHGTTPGDAGTLALTPAGQEPPPAVARGSVVVQVRSADGAWLDYRIGTGGAATERPRGKQNGTHELSAERARSGEMRVRTQDRSVAHEPLALGAEDGPWVVVMPAAAAKVAGRADRVRLDVPGLEGTSAALETEDVTGTRAELELEDGGSAALPSTRRPQRVRIAATDSRPAGPWRWVHPRDGSVQSLPPPTVRRLSMGDGLDRPGALQEIFGPDGVPVPFTTAPGPEAGVVYVDAPGDAELVGRFRVEGADHLVPFWDGFAGLAKGLTKHRTVLVRIEGPDGKPARDAQVVANWPQSLPGATVPRTPTTPLRRAADQDTGRVRATPTGPGQLPHRRGSGGCGSHRHPCPPQARHQGGLTPQGAHGGLLHPDFGRQADRGRNRVQRGARPQRTRRPARPHGRFRARGATRALCRSSRGLRQGAGPRVGPRHRAAG